MVSGVLDNSLVTHCTRIENCKKKFYIYIMEYSPGYCEHIFETYSNNDAMGGGEKAIGMSIFLNLGMVVRQIEQSKKTCKFTIPLCSALSTLYLVLIANVNVEINISTRYYGVYDSFLVVLLIGILGIPLVILVSKLTTIVLKKSILEFWGQNTVVLLAFHGLIYKYIDMLPIETGEYYLWVVLKMLVALIICTLICYVANMVKDKKNILKENARDEKNKDKVC